MDKFKSHGKKILEKIRQEHIQPQARWKLNWKNYIFWVIFVGMILLGIIFFSFLLMDFFDLGFILFRLGSWGKFIHIFFISAPYLWIGLFIGTFIIGLAAFRSTKRGYRYNVLFVTGMLVLIIAAVGFLLHIGKMNSRMEHAFERGMPPGFQKDFFAREKRFSNPEDGVLAGIIQNTDADNFQVLTRDEQVWQVLVSSDTKIKKDLKVGAGVIILGEKIGDKRFEAKNIRLMQFPPRKPAPDFLPPPERREH